MALLSLLGLGFVQVGCAHPVYVESSVVVHSRVGQYPVYAQVGVPGPVIYRQPQVIYTPPPPPRVIYVPPVYRQVPGWGYGHEYRHGWGHDRHEGERREHSYDRHGRGDRDDWRR